MRTKVRNSAPAMLVALLLSACGAADRREVYRGSNDEALTAIVQTIESAERSVLARSPALPRPRIVEALSAARARGVLVEFVVCGDPVASGPGGAPASAGPFSIGFDPTHRTKGGAVFVIDSRTVVRTTYAGQSGPEAAMIIRDSAELGERIAAECRTHIARARPETLPRREP